MFLRYCLMKSINYIFTRPYSIFKYHIKKGEIVFTFNTYKELIFTARVYYMNIVYIIPVLSVLWKIGGMYSTNVSDIQFLGYHFNH